MIGNILNIDFELESREYNSNLYTDVNAFQISVKDENHHVKELDHNATLIETIVVEDDLPF